MQTLTAYVDFILIIMWFISIAGAVHSSLDNSGIMFRDCSLSGNSAIDGGSLYFGDYHIGIMLFSTTISDSSAEFGGAIYITQFNDMVHLEETVIQLCYGSEAGGALYVLSNDVTIDGCQFLENNAYAAGAVYSEATYFVMQRSVVNANMAEIGAGVTLHRSSLAAIEETEFVGNFANSESTISVSDCTSFSISGSTVDRNRCNTGSGGGMSVTSSTVDIFNNTFSLNTAKFYGGALYLDSVDVNMTDNLAMKNTAQMEGGSAVFLTSATEAVLRGNAFTGNFAAAGGGTVFWVASTMAEPVNISTANLFDNTNAAVYGPEVATEARQLVLEESNEYSVVDYTTFSPEVVVYLVDYYDQVVKTESSSPVFASVLSDTSTCYKSSGYVTGGFVERFHNGVANFTTLLAYCDPGYMMSVDLTSSITTMAVTSTLQTVFELSFRNCVTGEYFSDSICVLCETGTYSVTDPSMVSLDLLGQTNVCKQCPDGSSSCYGSSVILKDGFWRISQKATSTVECPYADSCRGGAGSGDELCSTGYEGPVCAVCSDGYVFRSSTQRCEPCSDSAGLDAGTILFLAILGLLLAIGLYIYWKPSIWRNLTSLDDVYIFVFAKMGLLRVDSSKDAVAVVQDARAIRLRFQARMKIYITLWQILSLLPFTLDLHFPNTYAAIASVLNIFNLGISISSLVSCAGGESYDAIDSLVVNTLYPIVVVALLWIARSVHFYVKGSKDASRQALISGRYFNLFLVFTYLILPFTSVTIFQTFSCQDVDPDDVESGGDDYMTVDYSVSCSSSKYHFGVAWAIASIFVYPIGIPSYYFYVLYSARADIKGRESAANNQDYTQRNHHLNSIQLLYEQYKPEVWYWEIVETANRLLLTGVLVVISQGSGAQVIVGTMVSVFFLKVTDVWCPYIDSKVQTLREICQWQIFFVFFLALVLKADFSSVEGIALDALLVLACTANIVLDLTHAAWSRCCGGNLGDCVQRYLSGDHGDPMIRAGSDAASIILTPVIRSGSVS